MSARISGPPLSGTAGSLECVQCSDVDLRKRRERLDGVAQDVERQVRTDRDRCLLQPLTRFRTERKRTGEPVAVAEQSQEAVARRIRTCVGLGLGDLTEQGRAAEPALGRTYRGGLR